MILFFRKRRRRFNLRWLLLKATKLIRLEAFLNVNLTCVRKIAQGPAERVSPKSFKHCVKMYFFRARDVRSRFISLGMLIWYYFWFIQPFVT